MLDKKSACEGWRYVYLSFSKDRNNVDTSNLGSYYYKEDCEKFEKLLRTGKKIIEEKIGKECPYFAFPYGKLTQANQTSIDIACKTYKYVFSQSDYKEYFSFNGNVINRRHFEPFWPVNHVKYFLSCKKKFQ